MTTEERNARKRRYYHKNKRAKPKREAGPVYPNFHSGHGIPNQFQIYQNEIQPTEERPQPTGNH